MRPGREEKSRVRAIDSDSGTSSPSGFPLSRERESRGGKGRKEERKRACFAFLPPFFPPLPFRISLLFFLFPAPFSLSRESGSPETKQIATRSREYNRQKEGPAIRGYRRAIVEWIRSDRPIRSPRFCGITKTRQKCRVFVIGCRPDQKSTFRPRAYCVSSWDLTRFPSRTSFSVFFQPARKLAFEPKL